MSNSILVTGGAGYIGSHTCKALSQEGYDPIVYDNLSEGFRHNVKWGDLIVGAISDKEKLISVLGWHPNGASSSLNNILILNSPINLCKKNKYFL